MIKKYCNMCNKDVTNDNHYGIEVDHTSKDNQNISDLLISWSEYHLCDKCFDRVKAYILSISGSYKKEY